MFVNTITRRQLLMFLTALGVGKCCSALATESTEVPSQPYFAGVNRVLQALAKLGSPIAATDAQQIAALTRKNDAAAVGAAERILDRYTLARVAIEADGYARTEGGGAQRTLIEQGWGLFLVRVSNPLQCRDKLNVVEGGALTRQSSGASRAGLPDTLNPAQYIAKNWLVIQLYEAAPLIPALSGLALEYRVVQLYSRDRGPRNAKFTFYTATDRHAAYIAVLQKRRGVDLSFNCLPTQNVTMRVIDTDGKGCMASLTIRDKFDRVYPLQAMRLAPDMYFHAHVYRADGETVRLPDGEYVIESKRGPEYLRGVQTVTIAEGQRQIQVELNRWIDPVKWGWYSGDVHIHAGGCAHYEHPTEGVSPETMIRHVRGEALSIGQVLTWGPSWYYQKQFFTGRAGSPHAALEHAELQVSNNASLQPRPTEKDAESLLRYDVEVSGFPSSHCGHLILLRLKEQDYPGTQIIQDWPSWNLPILQWAKSQGAVVGYAHCGHGMIVDSTELPNYEIPPMNGIGTQEAIVDLTHGITDFLAGCDTQPAAELNAWYHLLNCGYRVALVGETDYPCITDERPGVGRTYVRLEQRPIDDFGYEDWVRNLQRGRLYCGDGRSHFLDYKVNRRSGGEQDLILESSAIVDIEALVAARLEPTVPENIQAIRNTRLNGWHVENARIGTSRDVPIEVIVNGRVVEKINLVADGQPRRIKIRTRIIRSSWIALRILPSSHTYPIYARVGNKPIRASKRSAQWCSSCVDKLWEVKSPFIRESERPAAMRAFDHAREAYDTIARECEVD